MLSNDARRSIFGPSGVGRLVAIQAVFFALAEGSNIAVRHFLPLLQRHWIVPPLLFVRNTEHIQYSFVGITGFPGRLAFGCMCVLVVMSICYVFREDGHRDPAVTLLAGLGLAGISANAFEIMSFGYATDFFGVRIPNYGSATANIADLALGLCMSGFVVVWVRPKWLRPRWKLTSAMAVGAALFLINPAAAVINPGTPPTVITSSTASATVQSVAQKSWGHGITVKDVFPVRHCFVYGKDCHTDTAWIWEVDLYGKAKFTRQGHTTSDSASGYVDFQTGRLLGFILS